MTAVANSVSIAVIVKVGVWCGLAFFEDLYQLSTRVCRPMLCLSSKKSLLSGVSAVVLATTFGVSGAWAQAVTYTHSSGGLIWAESNERTSGRDGNLRNAASGDNLTLEGGTVDIDYNSNAGRRNIGILSGGTNGAGVLQLQPSTGDFMVNIGSIVKQAGGSARAVDLSVLASIFSSARSPITLNVAGEATVRNFSVALNHGTPRRSSFTATFSDNLTAEGTTQLAAGDNVADSTDATLVLKGAVNKFAGDITLDDQPGGKAYLVLSGSADQRIVGRSDVSASTSNSDNTGQIKAQTGGEGTIKVLNGRADQAPRQATFDIQLGESATKLGQLTVGDATKGGSAIFNAGVHVKM